MKDKKNQWKKEKQPKRKKKYIAYRVLILFYHRGKGPLLVGETLAFFLCGRFGTWWETHGNPMNGTENNDKTKKQKGFLGAVSTIGGWFWRSDFVFWILGFGFGDLAKKQMRKKRETTKRKKMYIAYGGLILFCHRGKALLGKKQ